MVQTGKARGTSQIPSQKERENTREEKFQAVKWEKRPRFDLLIFGLIGIFLVCLVTKSCYSGYILAARVAWEGKVVEWENQAGGSEQGEGQRLGREKLWQKRST